jgi:curli biogenesis system outer membrane secretion channel CsgG
MKKYISLALIGVMGVSFLGCSAKKVSIRAQLPAEVDTLTKKKDIAVLPFKGDNVNFSGRLETKLASVTINGKPYFHVINRDKINDVLKELKFQSSDLVGSKAAQFGKLAGAKVLITGNVKTSKRNSSYKKPKERCAAYDKKGRCLYTKTVYVTCQTANATFNATINAIDVNTAQIVDAYNVTKNYQADSCKDTGISIFGFGSTKKFKTADEALNELADEAATEYVNRVAPHYVTLNVELIDKVKTVDLNDKQEKMFENALTYIEHGRLQKAEYILKKLNEQTRQCSYEIAYDLGVVEEALGKLEEAQAAYQLADKIITDNALDPSELVDKAIERIKALIQKRKKLQQQI